MAYTLISRLVLIVLTIFLLVACGVEPAAAQNSLVGQWVSETEQMKMTILLLPDGRYSAEIVVENTPVRETGRYVVRGTTLRFEPEGDTPGEYLVSLRGTQMTLTGTNATLVFEKVSGTTDTVEPSTKQADTTQLSEDDQWRARIRIAKMTSQPPQVPVGEVPADPNPRRIFSQPTVFTNQQLYYWMTAFPIVVKDHPEWGELRSTMKYYFFTNGRFFFKSVQYHHTYTTREGNVTALWGRYHVQEDEQVQLESDAGEKLILPLKYGRRNLIFGETVLGQIDWENEALQRYLNK